MLKLGWAELGRNIRTDVNKRIQLTENQKNRVISEETEPKNYGIEQKGMKRDHQWFKPVIMQKKSSNNSKKQCQKEQCQK